LNAFCLGEALKQCVKCLAVAGGDDGGGIGGFDGIGVTVADDDLGAHQIDDPVEQSACG
jgi:hypothetical protein